MGNCFYYKNNKNKKNIDNNEKINREITYIIKTSNLQNKTNFDKINQIFNYSTGDLIPIDYNIGFHESFDKMINDLKLNNNNKFFKKSLNEMILGQFNDKLNTINGYTLYKFNSHLYYIGNFKNNKFHNLGIFISRVGIYNGYFNEGFKHGNGIYADFKTNIRLEGEWENGIFIKGKIFKNNIFITEDLKHLKLI